ncbi:acetate--CoA ligase family protein [Actinoplanes subtropicus]|uniref:acetate--CoA ligase family protein n=1 Tax=Actinoplanes subtropicus TaxID=543632 RepID=UPI0004C3ED27|nr:acetate--CoA ligase family protein [Actinoplanes subtropicus]
MTAVLSTTCSLDSLFAPRGVAVIGASRSPAKLGAALARSLRGFPGYVALVNARDAGPGMHTSVRDAAGQGPIDLAMICLPAAACATALAEAAAAGARAAIVYGGGFAEAGPDGVRHQRELAAVAAETGIRLLGPNTSGFLAPHHGLTASFVPGAGAVPAGRVAVVAASGGVNHTLAFLLTEAGHGVSLAVGLGNGVDVTAADVLDHLGGRPDTRAVALHVESVPDGRRLVEAVARLVPAVPVVALVVGRNEVGAFAASHTGALATSWRTTRAALAQAGAVLVGDERELVDAVTALSLTRLRPAADPGVGVVTAQAGPGLLLLDELRGREARVPELTEGTREELGRLLPPLTYQRNPVDTGRPGAGFDRVLAAVGADPGVDVTAAFAIAEPDAFDLVAAVEAGGGLPLVVGTSGVGAEVAAVRRGLLDLGVPVAGDPSGVAAMIGALVGDARSRFRALHRDLPARREQSLRAGQLPAPAGQKSPAPARHEPPPPGWVGPSEAAGSDSFPPSSTGDPIGPGPWDEDQAKTLLDQRGIPTMPRRACTTRADAHQALADLPTPVAVKLLDAAVLHKTEIGGVRLNVSTPDQLDEALDALEAAGARRFLVESMAPPGVDLVVGARHDPVFGPVVLCGLGGTAAEALADVALRLAPLTLAEAAAMPRELAARALLDGWRGGPILDPESFAAVLVALGDLLHANPQLTEIEINPLRLTGRGLFALDAVAVSIANDPEVPVGHADQ